MNEDFLHHLWKFRLFRKNDLSTTEGQKLEILTPGMHNPDAGPDFFNARLKIGETQWAGNVEIHIRSSDWRKHKHAGDAAYNNVILHVVHEHDEEVFTKQSISIPTLELKDRFDRRLLENYEGLVGSARWIPCADHIQGVDSLTVSAWLDRLVVERLEAKTQAIEETLRHCNQDWEEAFYRHLARNFGFHTNSLPFEMLARSLPHSVLARHRDHLNQVEALLFGQAGLLKEEFTDEYPAALKKEYIFLSKKFSLHPMETSYWKFLRLRPSNFPTIRLAQFASLIYNRSMLLVRVLESENVETLMDSLSCTVSDYWKTHYTFENPSPPAEKKIGAESARIILINTVIPFIFAYGKQRQIPGLQQKAWSFLTNLPPEKNSIVDNWANHGITAPDAARTQALIRLKDFYCEQKKCLLCSIGNKIINFTT